MDGVFLPPNYDDSQSSLHQQRPLLSANVRDGSSIIRCSLVDTCVCRSSRPLISFSRSMTIIIIIIIIDGKWISRKWKSMFLLEYQWVRSACWWDDGHISLDCLNWNVFSFWRQCLCEEINIRPFVQIEQHELKPTDYRSESHPCVESHREREKKRERRRSDAYAHRYASLSRSSLRPNHPF